MKYYMFIDESGSFDEALNPPPGGAARHASVVGGICGKLSPADWDQCHRKVVQDYNTNSQVKFIYPEHFHSGPLLGGKIRVAGPFTKERGKQFVDTVTDAIVGQSLFTFASRNPPGAFQCSAQATYIHNLVTALRGAMGALACAEEPAAACDIKIGQRTINEIAQYEGRHYMSALIRYLYQQLQVGHGPGVLLARRLVEEDRLMIVGDIGDRDPGLMAADFVCGAIRARRVLSPASLVWSPERIVSADYEGFYEQEVARMIAVQQYAAAVEFLRRFFPHVDGIPNLEPVLKALRAEKDHDVLQRELNALLSEAGCLLEKRTVEKGALSTARAILEALDRIATLALQDPSTPPEVIRHWSDMAAHVLVQLLSCINHTGEVGPQAEIESRLTSLLRTYKPKMSLSFPQRQELLLDAKVRNLNLLFNDYRFDDVFGAIEKDAKKREGELPPGETDEILGKMQGSIGQALAYQARLHPEWAEVAHEYFRNSLNHFQPGTLYHAMSINYLATLSWQQNDLPKAIVTMNSHTGVIQLTGPADLVTRLNHVVTVDGISPFNVVNYLRLAALASEEWHVPTLDACVNICRFWEPKLIEDHPHEQLAKWLGYLFYMNKDYDQAGRLFKRSVDLCRPLSFTVRTIGLAVIGMQAINQAAKGDESAYAECLNFLRQAGDELTAKSTPFADYIASYGGISGLVAFVKERSPAGMSKLARCLPFNYS